MLKVTGEMLANASVSTDQKSEKEGKLLCLAKEKGIYTISQ